MQAASDSYSNYKRTLTAKYLIGVAPTGAITFVNDDYPVSTSDEITTDHSDVISHMKVSTLFEWVMFQLNQVSYI